MYFTAVRWWLRSAENHNVPGQDWISRGFDSTIQSFKVVLSSGTSFTRFANHNVDTDYHFGVVEWWLRTCPSQNRYPEYHNYHTTGFMRLVERSSGSEEYYCISNVVYVNHGG